MLLGKEEILRQSGRGTEAHSELRAGKHMIPCCIKRSVAATYIIYAAESDMSHICSVNY